MSIFKRFICLVLVLILLISSFSYEVFAKTDENSSKLKYETRLSTMYGDEWYLLGGEESYWDGNLVDELLSQTIAEMPVISQDSNNGSGASVQWTVGADDENDNNKEKKYKVTNEYGIHGLIIDTASSTSDHPISKNYIELVKEMCKKCDKEYGITGKESESDGIYDGSNNYNFCTAFHGNGNYYVTLEFLWTLCKNIGKNKDKDNNTISKSVIIQTLNSTLDNMKTKYGNDIVEEKWYGQFTIKKTLEMVKKILCQYYNDKTFAYNTKQSTPGRCKYLIYGIISHLLGDIYAHKVYLTSTDAKHLAGEVDEADITKMFDKKDFKNAQYNVDSLIKCLKTPYNPEYDPESETRPICTSEVKLFIKKSIKNDEEEYKILKRNLNKKYIDSNQFHPNRVKEATFSFSAFLDGYAENDMDIVTVIDPFYNFNLYLYDQYKNDLGL